LSAKHITQSPLHLRHCMWRFILPFPPSVNRYWIPARGRIILSQSARDYREAVITRCGGLGFHFEGRLQLTLILHPPDERKRDIEYYSKAVFDALEAANVYADDAQIDHCIIQRGDKRLPGRVIVKIRELEAGWSHHYE